MSQMLKVRLISHTTPTIELQSEGVSSIQELIAFCARVSNPSNQTNNETANRLLDYLIEHKHWSPFQMVDVTMELSLTRDIGRQVLRHQSFDFQEFSQRYADPTKDLEFITHREARLQDSKNRQNSIEVDDSKLQTDFERKQQIMVAMAEDFYQWSIEKGIAKEQARVFLPEGLTLSRMYMKGSIRSWIHYLEVRLDPSTQKEHRDLAMGCSMVLAGLMPYFNQAEES